MKNKMWCYGVCAALIHTMNLSWESDLSSNRTKISIKIAHLTLNSYKTFLCVKQIKIRCTMLFTDNFPLRPSSQLFLPIAVITICFIIFAVLGYIIWSCFFFFFALISDVLIITFFYQNRTAWNSLDLSK